MRFYFTYIIIVLIGVMMNSCAKDETCREDKNVTLNATFFGTGTTKELQIDTLTIHGLGNEALLHAEKNSTKINLPLNNTTEQSIFVLEFDTMKDTLWVFYTNQDYFISYECGSVISHKIDTVTTTNHYISNIKILNHDITTLDVQHLQIFH